VLWHCQLANKKSIQPARQAAQIVKVCWPYMDCLRDIRPNLGELQKTRLVAQKLKAVVYGMKAMPTAWILKLHVVQEIDQRWMQLDQRHIRHEVGSHRHHIPHLPHLCSYHLSTDSIDCNHHLSPECTTPQPFYGPFSGTTRVSRCQKRTSGLYGARED